MVSLRSMRYFNAALAHGSISRAAEELNIAASAVSAAIDKIEQQFQLKLVSRVRSRGIVATASGRIIERKFAHLLDEYDAVIAEGSDLKHAMKGELRIGYYAPIAPAFLPGILSGMLEPEHRTTIHLEECDNLRAQEGLLSGDFDVILFVSEAAQPQISHDKLIEAPAYGLLPAHHPLGRRKSIELAELAGEPIIVLNRAFAVDYYHRLFDAVDRKPVISAYANSTEMVRSLVGAGYGNAILNMRPALDTSYAGQSLVALPIADKLPPLTLAIGYDKSSPRRVVREFVNRCQQYFEEDGSGSQHIVQSQ